MKGGKHRRHQNRHTNEKCKNVAKKRKKNTQQCKTQNEAEQKKLIRQLPFRYSVERKVADATHASPKNTNN